MTKKTDNDKKKNFQFADDVEDQTWFRRAVKSGLHYIKQQSGSGLKLEPELRLSSDDSAEPKAVSDVKVKAPQARSPRPPPEAHAIDNAFKPQFDDKPLFQTAIHSFLNKQAKKVEATSKQKARIHNPAYHAAQHDSFVTRWKLLITCGALIAFIGLGAFILSRSQWAEAFGTLRSKDRRPLPVHIQKPIPRD